MKRLLSSFPVLVIASVLLPGPAAGSDPADALARWERLGQHVDYQELLSCADSVRKNTRRGNVQVFDRLIRIVRSDTQAVPSRARALLVACELADDRGAHRLLEMMETCLDRLRKAWDGEGDFDDLAGAPFLNVTLLTCFMDEGVWHVANALKEQEALLAFAKSVYLHARVGRRTLRNCARLIVECKVPVTARQGAVLEIIEERARGGIHDILLSVLTPGVFPELRRMVRARDTPDGFNFSAASALSYLGDQGIVPDLEARRPAFRSASRNLETVLRQYLWRIDVQHPRTKLLEYIGSAAIREQHHEMRAWAVRRAHELGVDRGQIRQAILRHAKDTSTPLERTGVPSLKSIGMELRILEDTDLPDVTIGDRGVTP